MTLYKYGKDCGHCTLTRYDDVYCLQLGEKHYIKSKAQVAGVYPEFVIPIALRRMKISKAWIVIPHVVALPTFDFEPNV